MWHPRVGRRALVMAGVIFALGCGGAAVSGPDGSGGPPPPPPPPPPAANTVRVTNNAFSPASITIARGATVTWDWDTCTSSSDPYGGGETCVTHSVAMNDGSSSSATQSKGSYAQQFNTAGTYAYHCAVHGAAMSGTVIVQ